MELMLCSYNIRREGEPDTGFRDWPNRIGKLVAALRRIDPDVFAVQEAVHGQAADLRASMTDYDFHGVARDDGKRAGEYAAIFWKRERFEAVDRGTFWLSDTPEAVGSKSWGNETVRTASWVRLVERASGRGFYVFNTHLDHRNQPSREQSTRLIARKIDERPVVGDPVVLMGDFNAIDRNPAVAYLIGERVSLAGGSDQPWKGALVDGFVKLHPDQRNAGTLHFWQADGGPPWRVDLILVSREVRVLAGGIPRAARPEDEPSDHRPVWLRVELTE